LEPEPARRAPRTLEAESPQPGPRGANGPSDSQPVPRLGLQRKDAAKAVGMEVDSFDRHVRPFVRCVYLGSLRIWPVSELERFLVDRMR
jgi:hypothetical protein